MKKTVLEMYLNKNLGDDLFLRMIAGRYPRTNFYVNAGNDYLHNTRLSNICGRNAFRKVIDKCIGRLFNEPKWFGKSFAAEIVLGGSMFIEQKKTEAELKDDIRKKYRNNIPLFIIGANFGPYNNQYYHDQHSRLFQRSVDVCFREKYSANLFKDLQNVRVAPDIIFGLDLEKHRVSQEKKVIISVIDLRTREKLRQYQEDYEEKITEIVEEYTKKGYKVVLMSFCKAEGDELAIERIIRNVKNEEVETYYYNGDLDEALKQISSSEIIIGTRFHSVVLGLIFEKKVLPIIYSDKTQNMLDDIAFKGKTLPIQNIASLDVSRIDEYLTSYGNVEELRIESEKHFKKLDELLGEDI